MAYPLAAFVAGWLAERGFDRRYVTAFIAMACGLAIVFAGGVLWLAWLGRRSRSASARREVDHAETPLRPERLRDVPQQRHRIARFARVVELHLVIRADDQRCIDHGRQPRIVGDAEDRHDVRQILVLHAPLDRLDHRRLDILREHASDRSDATREADREPAAS